MKTWINGRAAAAIDVRDRGLQYGDGLFETMRVRGRVIRLLDYHLQRLSDGCRRLAIAPPQLTTLRNELRRAAGQCADAVLKLIITRGCGDRGYRPAGRLRTIRIMMLFPLSGHAAAALPPVHVRLCTTRLSDNAALAGLKTLNRLDSVLARAEWRDARVWEGLMRDCEDNIVCGTMSNLFVRRGTSLMTPRLDRCGIAGVMRRWVLREAGTLEVDAAERRLGWHDLSRIDEAFMTNAVAGIVPVASFVRGRSRITLSSHVTAERLRKRLEAQ